MIRQAAAAAFAAALAALPAAARADLFSSVSYGVQASTIGHGITLEKPLLYDFSVRIQTGALSSSQQFNYDGTPFTSTTHYNHVAVIADYRPYAGRYRISGGLIMGSDGVDNVSHPDSSTIRVGNGLYPTSGTGIVSTHLRYGKPSVYAGVGTGTGLIRGLALTFDVGAIVRNGSVTVATTGPLAAQSAAFRADLNRLAAEQRTHVVVPVLSIGLVYRP